MSIECATLGSLVRDAEVKTSKVGKQYLRLNVRVESGDKAQFINVMAFDSDAIAVADQMVKSARVYVEGKLSLDEWTTQDGAKRTGLSVMAWHCRLSQIGSNRPKREKPEAAASSRERAERSAPISNADADLDDSIPF